MFCHIPLGVRADLCSSVGWNCLMMSTWQIMIFCSFALTNCHSFFSFLTEKKSCVQLITLSRTNLRWAISVFWLSTIYIVNLLKMPLFPPFWFAQVCKSYAGTGSYTPSPKSRIVRPVIASSVTEEADTTTTQAASSTTPTNAIVTPATTIICLDWSPQDDGIEVVLPQSSTGKLPSREDISSYIIDVLCGPTTRRRLRVFAEICSE